MPSTSGGTDGAAAPGPVAGLLLAAGAGRRLGGPKAVLEVDGERLVDRGVRTLTAGGCAPVHVVAGAVPLRVPGAVTVDNPDWTAGMGSSLRAGLASLPREATAVVVALADQPLVSPEAVRRLVAAHLDGATVAVASYAGRPRNPVLLAREHWPLVSELAVGDVGARPFLRANPNLVTQVACDDVSDPADIDTQEDLAQVRKGCVGQAFLDHGT